MRRNPPSTICRYLDLPSTQIIQTHNTHIHNNTPPSQTLVQAAHPLSPNTTHTTATKTQTHIPLPHVCKYKKSDTDPTLYRLHYSELLESFTDYTHIFLMMDPKMAIKQLRFLSVNLLSSQNVYLTRRQFLLLN